MRPVFLFVKCELGRAYDVADAIVQTIEETSEVYSVSGRFDLLAKFYLPSDTDTGRFVNDKVHAIADVKDTYTVITFNAFSA